DRTNKNRALFFTAKKGVNNICECDNDERQTLRRSGLSKRFAGGGSRRAAISWVNRGASDRAVRSGRSQIQRVIRLVFIDGAGFGGKAGDQADVAHCQRSGAELRIGR